MTGSAREIVVLGMLTRMPVAGVVWQYVHYLLGFQRLGYDVYYVEAHGRPPAMFTGEEDPHGSERAAGFLADVMEQLDLSGRWSYQALHDRGATFGLGAGELRRAYDRAAAIVNLHGATVPQPEHRAHDRLIYVETDPGELQVELHRDAPGIHDFLEPHSSYFTFAENLGRPGCSLPTSPRYRFLPTRQPVVVDLWANDHAPGTTFTTVAAWRQRGRDLHLNGTTYHWSKHREFAKFLDLPERSGRRYELALSSYEPEDEELLRSHGWGVRRADHLGRPDAYRRYLQSSLAEFTVAKDQNVRLRTGWFSDRSACYLAAGRPVITQDTGFGDVIPTGEGLFAFRTADEALAAVEAVASDPIRHGRRATDLARMYFGHETVLKALLAEVGL